MTAKQITIAAASKIAKKLGFRRAENQADGSAAWVKNGRTVGRDYFVKYAEPAEEAAPSPAPAAEVEAESLPVVGCATVPACVPDESKFIEARAQELSKMIASGFTHTVAWINVIKPYPFADTPEMFEAIANAAGWPEPPEAVTPPVIRLVIEPGNCCDVINKALGCIGLATRKVSEITRQGEWVYNLPSDCGISAREMARCIQLLRNNGTNARFDF